MATADSGPPVKGRSISVRIGLAGVLVLTLLVMAAIIVGLRNPTAGGDEPTPAHQPVPAGPAGALAQADTPTPVKESATAVPTATETQKPSPTPTHVTPTPTATPSPTALQTTAPENNVADAPSATLPTATPWPMPTPRETYSWTLKVPILMYHYISDPPEEADKYRIDLSTSPDDFREQMLFLANNGYETVDLYDLSLAIVNKGELPEKPIIITFDDGYRDNYENAFPALQDLGLRATFFVATEFVDQGNPDYVDWTMVKEMAAAGMRIEPHSKTHADLTVHDRDFIVWEVLGSQETIASHIGYRPRYFAYPGGRYNEEVQEIVSELDFWGAVTTANGLWHSFNDRFEWGRVRMRYTTSLAELVDMIE